MGITVADTWVLEACGQDVVTNVCMIAFRCLGCVFNEKLRAEFCDAIVCDDPALFARKESNHINLYLYSMASVALLKA